MRPTHITADKTRAMLTITWDNGETAHYAFADLAAACPCATCNDDREKARAQGIPFVPKSSELQAIEAVGSYGINIMWKDGCRFGIYTWDMLAHFTRQDSKV